MSEEVTARVALEKNCKILTCPRSKIRTKDHTPQGNPMPLAELIFVLFAILAIATPFITLILLGKYKRLRENLDKLTEENSRQHTSLQREVADLKHQLSAAAHPAAPVASGLTQKPAAPAAPTAKETPVPTPHVDLSVPVKLPAPMSFPIPEKKPEPQPLQKPQEPFTPAPVPIAPASAPMQSRPAPTAPVQPKLAVPAAAKTPAEVKPPAPVAPSQTTPPLISSSQPPAPRIPASPPLPPAPAAVTDGVPSRRAPPLPTPPPTRTLSRPSTKAISSEANKAVL